MLASCEPEKARMEHRRLCSLCFLPYPFLLPEANGMEFEQVRERESWGGIDGQVDGAGVRSAVGGEREVRVETDIYSNVRFLIIFLRLWTNKI